MFSVRATCEESGDLPYISLDVTIHFFILTEGGIKVISHDYHPCRPHSVNPPTLTHIKAKEG